MYGDGAGDQQSQGCSGPEDTEGRLVPTRHSHALWAQRGWRPGHASPGPAGAGVPFAAPYVKLTQQVQSHMGRMNGSHKSELHTDQQGRETQRGTSSWGRGGKPLGTYLLTQNKQGQPVTEQKGGSHRQKENNKKAHLNHSSKISHTKPRERHAGSRSKCTCLWYRKLPWVYQDAN